MFEDNPYRQAEYSRYNKKIKALKDELFENLTDKQKELYDSISLLKLQQAQLFMEEYYEEGVAIGTRHMIEIYEDS